jgi:carbonic anhydrase
MFNNIYSEIKSNFVSGVVVFLVAVPLCLGIALASGAPMVSGIISGIIGGIVVGIISKSHTSVSGPAAGMAAVVLSSITELNSFQLFLSAVIIAGCIQVFLGLIKAGFIANLIPNNVIKGLLAAIGIILILKQIPHAVGYDMDSEEDFSFFQKDGHNTFSELFYAFNQFTLGAVIISVISLLILIYWNKTIMKNYKFFPSALIVVIFGIGLNLFFKNFIPSFSILPEHLVYIPPINVSSFFENLGAFNILNFGNSLVWKIGLVIAVVASIETLLNIEAVDKIDTKKRATPPNRELIAQGIGNICSGLLGGIPVTSVIVRSTVNIDNNNTSKYSTIIHGILILIAVIALSPVLNQIPLASLAAILIFTGYKLASMNTFKEMYAKGWYQFFPFVATILAIVFTDLLIGVLIGLVIGLIFILKNDFMGSLKTELIKTNIGEVYKIELQKQASFLNKLSLKKLLWDIAPKSKLIIDASNTEYIDGDVLEIIDDFRRVYAPENDIKVNLIGLKSEDANSIEFYNTIDKITLDNLKPTEVLDLLKEGNQRHIEGKHVDKYTSMQVNSTAKGQYPMAVILSCIDSRTTVENIFDQGLGDVFSCRIAGNIVNDDIIGSMEFACNVVGSKLVMVLGHSKCGAIKGACDHVQMGNLTQLLDKLKKSVDAIKTKISNSNMPAEQVVEEVCKHNITYGIELILERSPILQDLFKNGKIGFVGAYYDIETGKVEVLKEVF